MTEQAVVQWVTDYGYFGIFFLLIFGIIGLPVPDEWLLVISGYLAFKNVLGFVPTVAVAVLGSAGGLTMSYVLGRTSSGRAGIARRVRCRRTVNNGTLCSTEYNMKRHESPRSHPHARSRWLVPGPADGEPQTLQASRQGGDCHRTRSSRERSWGEDVPRHSQAGRTEEMRNTPC